MKTWLVVLGMMALCVTTALAGKKKDYEKAYNVVRAMELLDEEKYDEAERLLNKELEEHKDNGYAWVILASVQTKREQYGEALTNVNKGLKCLDKKDEYYAGGLYVRSLIYVALDDDKRALDDLNLMVKLSPKDADVIENRATYLVNHKHYALAYQDFQSMIELEPGNDGAYVGSGICLRNMNRNEEAVKQYDHAIKLNPKYSRAFAQRGLSYLRMGQVNEAADDFVKALDIDGDGVAFSAISVAADSSFETMDFKLKVQQMIDLQEPYWPYCRAYIREHKKMYAEAIELYEQCNKMSFSTQVISRISECKYEMGDFDGALATNQLGLDADSTDVWLRMNRGQYLDESGRSAEAIAEYTHVIELAPRFYGGYHKRGWVKDNMGDTDGAIEDYSMSIMVDPTYVYNYLSRGNMYERKGMKDLARKDFEEVLKRDTVPSQYVAAYYAWWYLGERDKALAAMDSVLVNDSIGTAYDAACLYSRMGEKEKAINYLGKALAGGFRRFAHIERDDDLDNIREMVEFKALIEEYKAKAIEEGYVGVKPEDADSSDYEERVSEIPFTHEAGVTKVRCRINDLPLHFVFDTGASDVTISTVEATFMLKNGYLSEKDITGRQYYQTADGNISEGTTIILRKVVFGDMELEDVKASVSKSQKAPLLLGQSVLQRLGKIEIDNARNVLKVTQRVKK